MMEVLIPALDLVLGHAVAALECEDRDDKQQGLHEYNSAWCALYDALELHSAGETSDSLPELVRETCAALLETYSARYEAIHAQVTFDSHDGRRSDIGRTVGLPNPTTSSSAWPILHVPSNELQCHTQHLAEHKYVEVGGLVAAQPCHRSAVAEPSQPLGYPTKLCCDEATVATYDGSPKLSRNHPKVAASVALDAAYDYRSDHGTSRRFHHRCDTKQRPPTPTEISGVARVGDADDKLTGYIAGCFGRFPAGASVASIPLTDLMKEVFQMCHRPVLESSSLEDLAGLGSVKDEVRMALLLPLRMPHLFQGIRQPARNFLLYGPPGTGKTMLVERIAAEAGAKLLVLTPGAILSKWSGESEKQLRAVFDVARVMQPCIIFMDEVDSLAPIRGSGDDPIGRRLLNELLVQMSCLASGVAGPGSIVTQQTPTSAAAGGTAGSGGGGTGSPIAVYVFAATNRIQDCDPALLRRFDRRVAVPLPDLATRSAFLSGVLTRPEVAGHGLSEEEVRQVAERTEGYSGSDLAQLCREAAMQPLRELLRSMAAAGGYWGRGETNQVLGSKGNVASRACTSGAAGGGIDSGLQVGPRPLMLEDFEWALGVVLPAARTAA